ncbi:unknown [Akkermansia muciniphila CAG:154]|nr:unknown [Akkermansia muciniphila CAG:154]
MQGTERIRKTGLKQPRKPGALLVAESGGKTVLFGTRDVNLLMGHVQIPAENDRLDFRQSRHILAERGVPLLPVRKTRQFIL